MRPCAILSLAAAASFAASLAAAAPAEAPRPPGRAPTARATLAPALAKVFPAVVTISVRGLEPSSRNALLLDPYLRSLLGLPDSPAPGEARREPFRAVGSGVVYDAGRGYIVTCAHVIANADRIVVTLADRRQVPATLVGSDPETDVAVLRIEAQGLTGLPPAAAQPVQVGDYVVAIGNAFGVGQTATFGIVSAVGRSELGLDRFEDFIQTDASINPGNSGGALVDTDGALVGINTAIISRSGGSLGVGFAIPAEMVRTIAEQLITVGRVARGDLGVELQDLTPALAAALSAGVQSGAVVSQVRPGSAAARAELEEGDVVAAIDGQPVFGSAQVRNEVGRKPPGAMVDLDIWRAGKQRPLAVMLDVPKAAPARPAAAAPQTSSLLGMTLTVIPRSDPRFGEMNGVYVARVDPGSAAEEADLRRGDVILSADRKPVATADELSRAVRDRKGAKVLLRIRRGDAALFAALG